MTTQPLSENGPVDEGPVTYSEDINDRALTPEQRENAEVTLEDPEFDDFTPWRPPEQRPIAAQFADGDPADTETIDQRIRQEEPEVGTAYGAPNPHGEYEELAELGESEDPAAGLDIPEPEELTREP